MESALEVLPSVGRGRRNRRWPDEVKARIVAQTLMPGASVNEVAQRYGIGASHLSSWRTLARKGQLVLPAPEEPVEFAALMIRSGEDRSAGPVKEADRPEIVVGTVVIRLEVEASAERIASVARALAAGR